MNQFIRDNLTDEEIDLILTRHAEVKRSGFGRVETTFEDFKMSRVSKIYSENPKTFKTMYAAH